MRGSRAASTRFSGMHDPSWQAWATVFLYGNLPGASGKLPWLAVTVSPCLFRDSRNGGSVRWTTRCRRRRPSGYFGNPTGGLTTV